MFLPKRAGATLAYLLMIVVTLVVAFKMDNDTPGKTPLILLCVLLQVMALTWYTLSCAAAAPRARAPRARALTATPPSLPDCAADIPFARDMVLNCAKGMCKMG
jgi:hypothetical protein